MTQADDEQLRRWRLVLGGGTADGTGVQLRDSDLGADQALQALYDAERTGGLGSSQPNVARPAPRCRPLARPSPMCSFQCRSVAIGDSSVMP